MEASFATKIAAKIDNLFITRKKKRYFLRLYRHNDDFS